MTKAEEAAITEKSVQEARKIENARLNTEGCGSSHGAKGSIGAGSTREFGQGLLRLEEEKKESGQQAEVDRERRVGLSTQEKEVAIIAAAFGVAESKAGLGPRKRKDHPAPATTGRGGGYERRMGAPRVEHRGRGPRQRIKSATLLPRKPITMCARRKLMPKSTRM